MEIHEEFRINISNKINNWCYYSPLDVIIFESNHEITVIEAATGCINRTFDMKSDKKNRNICLDILGKEKLVIAQGNVFNCRSRFHDIVLLASSLQEPSYNAQKCVIIDLPMPESQIFIDLLKTNESKWMKRDSLGFTCSLDLDNDKDDNSSCEHFDNVWKWNIVTFSCPINVLYEWILEITMEFKENFTGLPLMSSIIYRIKSLQMMDHDIRFSIFERSKEFMNIEANRFLSFEMWPHRTYKWATPELMSRVGFYHHPRKINDDRALCFLCNICLITWEATDEPWSEHQRHSPSCPLFKNSFTTNVPLSISEATMTAQKQNSHQNITLIAKSAGNRYVATISDNGHICIWDTGYLLRKLVEFDTPDLSKDGSISIDSACLIDNSLLVKNTNKTSTDTQPGFHLVLGVRLIVNYNSLNNFLPTLKTNDINSTTIGYLAAQESINQQSSFIYVIEIPYEFNLVTSDERKQFPEFANENVDFQSTVDFEFFEESNQQAYSANHFISNKNWYLSSYDDFINDQEKDTFLAGLGLSNLHNEIKDMTVTNCEIENEIPSEKSEIPILKPRNFADTNLVDVIPIILNEFKVDIFSKPVIVADIYPVIVDMVEENETISSVCLLVNCHREKIDDSVSVDGALLFYKCLVNMDTELNLNMQLQNISKTFLLSKDCVRVLNSINIELLESNCSESSSTTNADEVQQDSVQSAKNIANKSQVHWLLLTRNNEIFLYATPLLENSYEHDILPLSEIALRVPLNKDLSGTISGLQLFSDMDRLCLLTSDGIMAFYTIATKRRSETNTKSISEANELECPNVDVPDCKPLNNVPKQSDHPITPEPLLVEQDCVIDQLNQIYNLIQYEIVTSRIKLTYGCNWVEVSQSEIIDLKTNGSNFITTAPITLRYLPTKPSSTNLKVSDQQQCYSRTLNFRASQVCSREQIIEFSTAKQICLGHVDIRFDLYEKQSKDSNLIYVTLLRQHKYVGMSTSKDPNSKPRSSIDSNIMINDLEAPFIDDDMAQYYDSSNSQEPNSDVLRKLDGEIVAGPYLLNKYYQPGTTSIFLSMTSAELIKCRSRHYAIHIRVRSPITNVENRFQSSSPNSQSIPIDLNNYGKCDSSSLNIKSVSLSLRKFSNPSIPVHNDRSQRLAILRNPKFLRKLLKLISGELKSTMTNDIMVNHSFDILNWIIVMYLNDIKPHSEKIYKLITTVNEYLEEFIYQHFIHGDRVVAKKVTKILTSLINLEKRYWSFDSRFVNSSLFDCYKLCKTIYSIFKSKITWLLQAKSSVAVQNYFILLNELEQLFVPHSSAFENVDDFNISLFEKLTFLEHISEKYSHIMSNNGSILLRSILGYSHNPLTGELFDIHITDLETNKSMNNLHTNLARVINRKTHHSSDFGVNDIQTKNLLNSLSDQVYKQVIDHANQITEPTDDIISNNFSFHDLQKAFREMVMENVKNNIQLMRAPSVNAKTVTLSKTPEPIDLIASNLSSINYSPWFKSLLWSKMSSKSTIYTDMKKKSKLAAVHYTTHPSDSGSDSKVCPTIPDIPHPRLINMLRNHSILEVDFLPVYFESASEGTVLDTVECMQFDQLFMNDVPKFDNFHQISINPLSFIDERTSSQPVTTKTASAVPTDSSSNRTSPENPPLLPISSDKSILIDDNHKTFDTSNDQRLNYSLQTNCEQNAPRMSYIIVNRLHANARRNIILNLRQWSVITDIVIPSCDKLQKIIIRVGPTNKEEEMQTIVIHSSIIAEPLLLLNIQPEIICHFVQIVIIAKSNITAERSRINIGTIYGRPALMSWEVPSYSLVGKFDKNSLNSVSHMLEYLLPRSETISMNYALASETLRQLLQKLSKCGINQQMLSDTLPDYPYHGKSNHQSSKQVDILKLLNQINNVYHKCCQLQQQLSVINNHINRYRLLLQSDASTVPIHCISNSDKNSMSNNCHGDKLKILIELTLESLLLDRGSWVGVDNLNRIMELVSSIMTNLMIYGTRDMQILIISWIPKMITLYNDSGDLLRIWFHVWLKDFMLRCFTNKNLSVSPFIKEEIFSYLCVIFQRLANAGYHQQLFENMLDIFIIILQPGLETSNVSFVSIDIELFNWILLFLDFLFIWIKDDELHEQENSFSEWKFLFWNPYINNDMNEKLNSKSVTNNKEKFVHLKQQLVLLTKHKENFIEYLNETGYDSWFFQLIVTEYSSMYEKLLAKITATISKLKKTVSSNIIEKPVNQTNNEELKYIPDLNIKILSSSISTVVKLLMNTLKYMDFQVSQDTFILTCMVLNKLFILAQVNGFQLNNSFDKNSLSAIVERAFIEPLHYRINVSVGVFSLHACRILLMELVRNDIKILMSNKFGESFETNSDNLHQSDSIIDVDKPIAEAGIVIDNDSVLINEDEDDIENDDEDITPTGADDEDVNSLIEPYAVYVTHLGNLSKQKDICKFNEDSPSDEYTDLVEEFDLLGHPTSFISSYAKNKFPKDYQASIKTIEMEKSATNQIELVRNENVEIGSFNPMLYYDLRLENSIFTDQEISFNQNLLKWRHQMQNDIYEHLPICSPMIRPLTTNHISQKLTKPLAIAHIFESIDDLLDDCSSEKFNIQEIASFVCHICHLLEKENVLVEFDSLHLSSSSLLSLLERLVQLCSTSGSLLLNYCQLVSILLNFQSSITGKIKFFKIIFQLADELDNRDIIEEVLDLFQLIVIKSLESVGNDSKFVNVFLDVVYDIIDNWHLSKERPKSKSREQLASIFIVCIKSKLIDWLQINPTLLPKYVYKVSEVTSRFLRGSSTEDQRKCFSSLVPEIFAVQLLQIEQSALPGSIEELLIQKQVFVQLNLVILEIITVNQQIFSSIINADLLKSLFISLSQCHSSMLETSKCFDVFMLSSQLVKHTQTTTVADIIWQQIVLISKLLLSVSNEKSTLLSSLTETIQLSIPTVTEPLFLISIWLIPQLNVQSDDDICYTNLLASLISAIVTFSNSRLSISPVNTFATRLAVSIMQQTAKPNYNFPNLKTDEISNNSRPNVSPFCQISCQGNDSSDPQLLAKLLSSQIPKAFNTLRSNRSKTSENVWSYEFYPHETQVQITINLPCDMIVHKIILIPRSIREFSPKFEVVIKRDTPNHSTTNYQQIHKSLILNDGIIIDHINSRKLSNKIIIRFDKPLLSKLVLEKIEICTINQWWDHRFQLAGDVANLFIYRCLHLFNHILKNQSMSVDLTLLENIPFFLTLLNWNHMYSIANSPTNKLLIKNSSNLITDLLVYLGQKHQEFSIIILNQILENVSLISMENNSSSLNHALQFLNEISMMKLSIFYNLLIIEDKYSFVRVNVIIKWFSTIEFQNIVTLDSVASIVYLLSVVVWHHSHNCCSDTIDWLELFTAQFIHKLRITIINSSGMFKKSLCRLLSSVCSIHKDFYQELFDLSPVIQKDTQSLNFDNLKLILWASQSDVGSNLLLRSNIFTSLIDRINLHLSSSSAEAWNTQIIYTEVSKILKFFTKLCIAGCNFIKIFLGSFPSNSFWQSILDYLIDYSHCPTTSTGNFNEFSSIMKVDLNTAVVKFFSAVTFCCEPNQVAFIKILIGTMDKYRLKSDTLILSDCIRRLILEVVVKEPEYCVVVESVSSNNNNTNGVNLFPGWLMCEDEFGNSRLSFRHPSIASQKNCVYIDNILMTNQFSSIVSQLSDHLNFTTRKSSNITTTSPKITNSYSEVIDYFLNKFSDSHCLDYKLKQAASNVNNNNNNNNNINNHSLNRLPLKFNHTTSWSVSLQYGNKEICNDDNLLDFVTKNETNVEYNGGFLKLSCSIFKFKSNSTPMELSATKVPESNNYLLVKFTELGGLKLLGKMLPLLFTDIRRISSTTTVCRTPVNNITTHTGFVDDELTTPTDSNKSQKSLPQIPAHSITAFCLFLNIDQFPFYVINEKDHCAALLHLLLGVTYDNDGVSLLQKYPKLQCVPFILLSRLLQNQSISSSSHQMVINSCIELGLIDYFINLLSILGHVDSGQSLKCLKSSGPWWKFISQTLFDLHYQLFYPLSSAEKPDVKSTSSTQKSAHIVTTTMDPKSHYITFMPFIDEKKNYWAKGTGFGTGGMYSTWDSEFVLMRQNLEELNASAILDTLSAFIYPSDEETDYIEYGNDILPSRAIECIYQSTLLVFISSYLRNDSVLDVSQHVNIYKSILRLIRALAKQKCFYYFLLPHITQAKNYLDPLLYQSISNLASTNNISQLLSQLKVCVDTYINRLKKVPGATNKIENTRRLQRQFSIRRKTSNYVPFQICKSQKVNDTENKDDQNGAESENLAQLLPDINLTVKLINDVKLHLEKRTKQNEIACHITSTALNNGYVDKSGDNSVEDCFQIKISKENHYIELMRKLQFGMFEIIHPNPDQNGKIKFTIPYHFKKNVESIFSTNSPSASLSRARRLAQETVTLSTSLPLSYSSSVFVRCDENHLDIMKVIIVGPPDTPYANGCFEFDVYFPMEYPKAPPLLNLQTTGNGSVRFNPNLYNEGKVCLSILNTWHGRPEERWSSKTSSFLQVLVSIQSLILVPEPYFNEPGYERSRGTPSGNNASLAYSANIQAATARWAILEMIKNPPVCFAEVIKQHFLLKKDEIINQIQSWIDFYLDSTFDTSLYNSTRPSISNSVQSLKKNIILIKKELENLEKENLQL